MFAEAFRRSDVLRQYMLLRKACPAMAGCGLREAIAESGSRQFGPSVAQWFTLKSGSGGPCPLEMGGFGHGDAMMQGRVTRPTIIGSPTSSGGGPPEPVVP